MPPWKRLPNLQGHIFEAFQNSNNIHNLYVRVDINDNPAMDIQIHNFVEEQFFCVSRLPLGHTRSKSWELMSMKNVFSSKILTKLQLYLKLYVSI